MIVCGPGWSGSVEAGKKRRDASLDRLRERNATERWNSLQKMWRPLSEDAPPAAPAESIVPSPEQPTLVEPGAEPVFVAPQTGPAPLPSSPRSLDGKERRQPGSPEPIWVFDEVTEEDPAEQPPIPDGDAGATDQGKSNAAKPRSISTILPYYDYHPEGTPEKDQVVCTPDSSGDQCPMMEKLPYVDYTDRAFADIQVAWEPSNLFANPLYFEDAALERYGHTHNCLVQPFASLGKFGVQLVGLPYQMALHPVHEHRYALGWY